jgi:hypothetical protein
MQKASELALKKGFSEFLYVTYARFTIDGSLGGELEKESVLSGFCFAISFVEYEWHRG